MARSRHFWSTFGMGAAAGLGAALTSLLAWNAIGAGRHSRVLRIEKSLQVGRPVEEVFGAWSNLERLPEMCSRIEEVRSEGKRSHWRVRVDGVTREWDAELVHVIPNQALGWKSVRGPQHSGRINFSPLGNDTLVHVHMNYAPRLRWLRPILSPATEQLELHIEQVLRDFKAALEGKGQEDRAPYQPTGQATGTEGRRADLMGAPGGMQTSRFGGPANPADHSRPPEKKGP